MGVPRPGVRPALACQRGRLVECDADQPSGVGEHVSEIEGAGGVAGGRTADRRADAGPVGRGGTPDPPSGWRGRVARRKQERAAAKERAKAERERARQERRAAIESRRRGRRGVEAPADAEPAPESEPSPAAEATGTPTAREPSVPDDEALAEERARLARQREEEALVTAAEHDAEAAAERRVAELERLQRLAEQRVAQLEGHGMVKAPGSGLAAADENGPSAVTPDVDELGSPARSRRDRDRKLLEELERTESSIGSTRQRTDEALEQARERLQRIEERADQAEERAERAERLAREKRDEADRERRLHEILARIDEAEERAREAERRARAAVEVTQRPRRELPPVPEPPPGSAAAAGPHSLATEPDAAGELGDGEGDRENAPGAPLGRELSLNEASFEELRRIGLSVNQAGRVLAYRERNGGFDSIDEIEVIPGISQELADSVKDGLRARRTPGA